MLAILTQWPAARWPKISWSPIWPWRRWSMLSSRRTAGWRTTEHTHTHTHSILSSMLMHFNQWSMSPAGVTWPSFSPSPAGFLRTLAFSRKHWLMFAAHDNAVISSLNVKIETLMMISLIVIHERGHLRRLVCVCVCVCVWICHLWDLYAEWMWYLWV